MRNYVEFWIAKYHYAPLDQTTYGLGHTRDEVADPGSSDLVGINHVYLSLNREILIDVLRELGNEGRVSIPSFQDLGLLFDWPFPAFPVVTYSSPRQRNSRKGWFDKL